MATYLPSVPAHRTDTSCFEANLSYHPDRILSADALRLRGWQRMQAYNRLQSQKKQRGNYAKCNGHHRELWCALVFILQQELRKLYHQSPASYEAALRSKVFVIETNRKNLRATMLARYSDNEAQQGVCIRTISNLLDRLVDIGLIYREKAPYRKANFKITLSSRFLMLQKLQLTYNSNGIEKKENNQTSDVDKVFAAPIGEAVSDAAELGAAQEEINELVRSKTVSDAQASTSNPKNFAGPAPDYAQRVENHRVGQKKEVFLVNQLWTQAKNCLYPGWRFHSSTEKDILGLLQQFLHDEATQVATQNDHALQQFCAQNPKYQEAKKANNEDRMIKMRQWLRSRQPDPWNEAFSLLSRAIDIQRQYCEQQRKKTYEPYTFFSQEKWAFERVTGFAKKEAQTIEKQAHRSEKKEATLVHATLKRTAKKFLLQTTLLLRDRGTGAALQKYVEGRNALIELLKAAATLSERQKWSYLNSYNIRLQHIFNPQKNNA